MVADRTAAADAGARIGGLVDATFASLESIVPVVGDLLRSGPVTRADLGELDRVLLEAANLHAPIVDGAGVAFAPDSITDAPRWLEWWRPNPTGDAEFRRHVFNPASLRDYDYTHMRWYTAPLEQGGAVAVGPYLDSGGTDRNVVTIAVPAVTAVGTSVVAADLRLDGIERAFRDALGSHSAPVVLVNDGGRVIASKSARYPAGSIVVDHPTDRAAVVESRDPRRLPWRVLTFADTDRSRSRN